MHHILYIISIYYNLIGTVVFYRCYTSAHARRQTDITLNFCTRIKVMRCCSVINNMLVT